MKIKKTSQVVYLSVLAGLSPFIEAANITYDGDTSMLGTDPAFNVANSLFPGTSLSDNQITVTDGVIDGAIFGGVTAGSEAVTNNHVTISGGTIGKPIYGGRSTDGNVSDNHVTITTGAITQVMGGSTDSGSATGNQIILSGDVSISGYIFGGHSKLGVASDNYVQISGGTFTSNIYGGYNSISGSAINNHVVISEGTINSMNVYGGLVYGTGPATANSVTVSGGTVTNINGGASYAGSATKNSVIISNNAVVNGNIYGGFSYSNGNANGNSVTISGGTIHKSIYGGSSASDASTNNSVTISGTPQFDATNTSIYGGFSSSGADQFTGNTLNYMAHAITVNSVRNFEQYHFTLNPAYVNDSTALISAQDIVLGDGAGRSSSIKVLGVQQGQALQAGDQFVLMRADNALSGDGVGTINKGVAQQGISLLYDIETEVNFANKEVTAKVLSQNASGQSATVNPQLKALSEGFLSGLMLVTRGADLVADNILPQEKTEGFTPFVNALGGYNRYSSGSHINSKDFLLTGGVGFQQTDFALGAFVESGWGNYDSYNSFSNVADVHGDGNTRYYGLGLVGRYDFTDNFYTEASLRGGNVRTKFSSEDIQNTVTQAFARYNLKTNYMSAHLGAGYKVPLDKSLTLDLSAKYLGSSVQGQDVQVAGDDISFNRINSNRARINADVYHQQSERVMLVAGLGYEYEFDGKAKANALGSYTIEAPSVKGSTGILSFGAQLNPEAYKNLTIDMKGNGYIGKRRGGGLSARVAYNF